jgi:predicted negative regulator of RcsB-dependent stress response
MADKISRDRKKELEQLDPFQENLLKVMAFVKEFKKQLILIGGAVVLVALIFSGIMYSFQNAENKADVLVSDAMEKYAKANDPEKGYLETEADFKTIFTEYANTNAGKLAKIQFAKICYEASKFDQSYQFYKEALQLYDKDELIKNFILVSLGHVCIARKEFDEAKDYFLKIEKGKTDLLKDEARFSLAMLDEASGNMVESKKMYEKIMTEHENSMYASIAKGKVQEMN